MLIRVTSWRQQQIAEEHKHLIVIHEHTDTRASSMINGCANHHT